MIGQHSAESAKSCLCVRYICGRGGFIIGLDKDRGLTNDKPVLAFLIHRAKALCEQDSLTQELEFLTTVFKDNGYSHQQIRRAMKPVTRTAKTDDKPTSTAYIPYTQTTFGRLSRMLDKHNIKSVTLPPRKIISHLPPVKDALGLRTPGIYSIPCECGRVYIGQSGRSVQLRIKEHNIHIRLAQPTNQQ